MILNIFIKYNMKILFPFYCLFTYTVIIMYLILFYYKLSKNKDNKNFEKTLDEEQIKIYNKIKKQRMCDYRIGVILGLFISFFYLRRFNTINNKQKFCIFIGLSFLIANYYYLLKPKKLWMVEHLKTVEQVKLHNKIYKKYRYISNYSNFIGFILFSMSNLF